MPKYLLASEIVDKVERKNAMKLSEAIILGDTLKKANPWMFMSRDGSCGCAIGGAAVAMGIKIVGHPTESPEFMAAFPWFDCHISSEIGHLYHKVCEGRATIEDVAAYVKTVEPAEPEDSDPGDEQPETDDYETGLEMSRNQFGDGSRYL